MSNNKQSSVEWYQKEMLKIMRDAVTKKITGNQWNVLEQKAFEQAKAMHKEEIMQAHYAPQYGCFSKEYYNETFGGNNESN